MPWLFITSYWILLDDVVVVFFVFHKSRENETG